MRVLITSPVFPPDLGGPAVYVPSLARWLLARGHAVRVVAFCSDPAPAGHPFPVVAITRGALPLRYLRAFLAVWREARRADIVYVNEHLALLHVLAARLAGRPCVIRIMVDGAWEIAHRKGWCGDDDIVTFQGKDYGWKVRLTRALQRRWWSWCSEIVACSEFLRQILIRHHGVPAAKVTLVHNAYHGPDAASVRETPGEARDRLGLPRDRRFLLTICRLMVWKQVDKIIETLPRLPGDVDLLVAGDGDMEAEWKALAARLGLAERVHFLGNVPHERIPLLVRASEAFVLDSRYEGLSHTLIEVQSLGTPIVASNVCGNPEVVEDGVTGLLVDPHNPYDLEVALGSLLADEALRGRFARAGLHGAGRFGRETTFPQVESVLARAAGT